MWRAKVIEAGRLDLRVGDGAELPWDDAAFDAAFSVLGFRERTDDAVARFPPPMYRFYSTAEVTATLGSAGFGTTNVRVALSGTELRIAIAAR
jgi:hypothetical protein